MSTGDAGFGDIARAMAEALRAAAGDGWSAATLQLQHTVSSVSCHAWTDTQDHLRVDYVPIVQLLLERPPSSLEVRMRDTGEYTFTACPDIGAFSPGRAVFDPVFRYPGHPLPGMPRPATAEPTGAPTDPAVLAEVDRLTGEFAELYAGIKGYAPPWAQACTEQELVAAEARIGARLPEDLRALYLVAGGDPQETGLLGRYSHNSLEQLVELYLEDGPPGSYGWEDALDDDGVVFDTVPFGTVKRLSRNDWWVTFGGDRALNYLAVDLDPALRGRAGQVIEYGRDIYGPLRYVSGSITDMFAEVVAALRAGKYEDPGEHYLDVEVGFTESTERSYDEVIHRAAEVDLPATVAALPRPELVQQVYVNDPGDLDLAVFAPLTSLRLLKVHRGQTVTPSVGGLEALESLQVGAQRVDVAALAGHPVLWDLQLNGITEPVDISSLRALPRLTRLNLAGSEVPDLEQVWELTSLRVLKIDARQVRRLLDSGRPVSQLAALYVTGKMHLRDMAELATAFSGDRIQLAVTTFSDVLP